MVRRKLALAACIALAVGGAMALAPDSLAATGGGACQLNGTANFTPNGPGATSTFNYSVTGQLTGCQSNLAGAPTQGTLEVGQLVVLTVDTPTGPAQATYAEPAASGSGALPVNSCPAGTTKGTGVTRWPDGTTTIVDYTTSSAGPAVSLQGSVVQSVTVTLVSGPSGAPATTTIASTNATFPVGNGVQGLVAFTTNNPTPCTSAAGLSSVSLQGTVGFGSAS